MRCLLVFVAIALATHTSVEAGGDATPTVAVIVLPTRHPDAGALGARAARLGMAVAKRLHAEVVTIATAGEPALSRLARAHELMLDAKLDEAAATYDLTLDARELAPGTIDGKALVDAHVARIQIALARGETARAEVLLRRVLRWDGEFAPTVEERTPAVQELFERLRTTSESVRVEAADLGSTCLQADIVVAVRVNGTRSINVARFDRCVAVSVVTTAAAGSDALVLDALAPHVREQRGDHVAMYQRPWFWITVSALAVSGLGVWALAASDDQRGYDVSIRF